MLRWNPLSLFDIEIHYRCIFSWIDTTIYGSPCLLCMQPYMYIWYLFTSIKQMFLYGIQEIILHTDSMLHLRFYFNSFMEGPKALLEFGFRKAISRITSDNIRPHSCNISPSNMSKCLFQALACIYNLAIILNTFREKMRASFASIVIKIHTDKVLKYWAYSLVGSLYIIQTTRPERSVYWEHGSFDKGKAKKRITILILSWNWCTCHHILLVNWLT